MSDLHNRSQTSARRGDYVWQYEYYDDEEPVSFEGLKAHRYSIVIGFWVGLAVFVIFMFFVLTLLTKTGAPHQENSDSAEKRQQPGSCMVDFTVSQQRNEKAFSRPLLMGPHSYFHFYIKEEDQAEGTQRNTGATGVGKTHKDGGAQQGTCSQNGGTSYSGMDDIEEDVEAAGGHPSLKEIMDESKTDRDCASLSPFNIPNYVNMEPNSTGADDTEDESSIVLERQSYPRDVCCDIH